MILCAGAGNRAGIETFACPSVDKMIESVGQGVGALLIAEEALQSDAVAKLSALGEGQPVWSDIPVIVFSSRTEDAERLAANAQQQAQCHDR